MDDTLEQRINISGESERNEDNEQDASDGEDGGLDWTKLPYVLPPSVFHLVVGHNRPSLFSLGSGGHATRPVIPKRGEKDFEPAHGGGSGLQRHNLERARSAMFDALRSTRAISRYDDSSL